MRAIIKTGYFLTAKGYINRLVDYGKTHVLVMTEKGKDLFQVKRTSIRSAISFFYFKRTAIRKDFEPFSRFTSALFAIIIQCFKDKSKLQKLKNGLFRISLLGTRCHFSGLERVPAILKLVKELNGKYVLFNYKSILESPQCLRLLETYDLYCIIESGTYSFFNENKKNGKK